MVSGKRRVGLAEGFPDLAYRLCGVYLVSSTVGCLVVGYDGEGKRLFYGGYEGRIIAVWRFLFLASLADGRLCFV